MGGGNDKIIYKKLSFKINGILFDVYNSLGYGHPEKYYEKAIATALVKAEIPFERQRHFNLTYKEVKIGEYYLDFLINKEIILELKKGNYFAKRNIEQIKGYLKATNLKLAILANFTPTGVKIFRLLNIKNTPQ